MSAPSDPSDMPIAPVATSTAIEPSPPGAWSRAGATPSRARQIGDVLIAWENEAFLAMEEAGAGIRIRNARELSEGMLQILADPQDAQRRGERGRAVVLANMGAAQRYAEMMIRHLA